MRLTMADCPTPDDVDLVAELVLAEAARGRAERVATWLVDALDAARDGDGGTGAGVVDDARRRAGALMGMERMAARAGAPSVDLGAWYSRFATMRMLASASIAELRTSVPEMQVDARLARGLAMITCELLQVVERNDRPAELEVRIAVERDGPELVLAISVTGPEDAPVPTTAGSRALRRAERLVGSLGGTMCRGARDGEMLFGVVLGVENEPGEGDA